MTNESRTPLDVHDAYKLANRVDIILNEAMEIYPPSKNTSAYWSTITRTINSTLNIIQDACNKPRI